MTVHAVLDDDARNRAALAALGSLPPDEAAAFETHAAACCACRNEVESLRLVVSEIALAAPEASAPAALRDRLLSRLRAEKSAEAAARVWSSWTPAPPGPVNSFSLESTSSWDATGIEGIEVRRLFMDPTGSRVTMLVRMAPKSAYPAHRHRSDEDCYVIEGDLHVGDVLMRAGDYKRSQSGSEDPVQWTEAGCLLFISSGVGDEFLPLPPA